MIARIDSRKFISQRTIWWGPGENLPASLPWNQLPSIWIFLLPPNRTNIKHNSLLFTLCLVNSSSQLFLTYMIKSVSSHFVLSLHHLSVFSNSVDRSLLPTLNKFINWFWKVSSRRCFPPLRRFMIATELLSSKWYSFTLIQRRDWQYWTLPELCVSEKQWRSSNPSTLCVLGNCLLQTTTLPHKT